MATEDFVVNDGGDWEAIETIGKSLPHLDRKTPFALVVKAVNAVDGCTLVIAPKQEKVLRIFDLNSPF